MWFVMYLQLLHLENTKLEVYRLVEGSPNICSCSTYVAYNSCTCNYVHNEALCTKVWLNHVHLSSLLLHLFWQRFPSKFCMAGNHWSNMFNRYLGICTEAPAVKLSTAGPSRAQALPDIHNTNLSVLGLTRLSISSTSNVCITLMQL